MAILNEKLAKEQKITDKQRENLDIIYDEMEELFNTAENIKLLDQLTFEIGHGLANDLRNLEFKLQENWNFPQDARFHTWWNKLPGCTCPKDDNYERFGQDKILKSSCPYHGFEITPKIV